MKKLAFNVLTVLFTIVFSISLTASPSVEPKKDYKKTVKKEFTISQDGEVRIENSYGKVSINPTGGNEVVIEVTIKVDKSSESKAEEFFEKVNIEFSNSRAMVSAETQIGNNKDNSWKSWFKPKNWGSNNNNYSIDYEVWMPSTCKLDLTNKYGNISVGDLDNDANVTLKYGDGIMQDIKGNFKLDLGYGDLKIGHTEDMDLNIKYGEFRCKSGHAIDCDSKYSDIYIDKAERLDSESGYDDFFIGAIDVILNDGGYDDFQIEFVDQFEFESKYSDYIIDELGSGGSFDTGYGDLKVKHVLGLSKGLDVDGKYTDVWLGMDQSFNLDLDTKYTDVDVPSGLSSSKNYSRIKDGSEEIIKVSNGKNNNNITAELRYGSFKIKRSRP